jgi:hypothetical protein
VSDSNLCSIDKDAADVINAFDAQSQLELRPTALVRRLSTGLGSICPALCSLNYMPPDAVSSSFEGWGFVSRSNEYHLTSRPIEVGSQANASVSLCWQYQDMM